MTAARVDLDATGVPGSNEAAAAAPGGATFGASDNSPRLTISRFEIEGESRLQPHVIAKVLRPFTGPDRDFATIQNAVAALERAYAESGYSAVRITIPHQDIDDGVVRLHVAEAKVGRVDIVGNKHYSERNIRASVLGLREGEAPNVRRIGASLRLANESSTKQTQLSFAPASEPLVVNATIRVADAPTQRWAATLDNTGTSETGHWRTGIAYQNTNLWSRDHLFAMQLVTAPSKPADVVIAGGIYRTPLYEFGSAIELVGGYANVNAGNVNTPAGSYGIKGSGGYAGMHYIYLLPRVGAFDQRLTAGLDFRSYQSDVTLEGTPGESLIPDLETLPVGLTYFGAVRGAPTEWAISFGAVQNIPRGSHGTTAAFQQPGGRANARASYSIIRYSGEAQHAFANHWRVRGVWHGQYTKDALISGEQFALGGLDAVRGFGERAIANDRGNRLSAEVYTPPLPSAAWASARLVAFVDWGNVRRNKALPGETTHSSVASAGVALRATVAGAIDVRIDTSFVVDGEPNYPTGSNKTHIRLTYLF